MPRRTRAESIARIDAQLAAAGDAPLERNDNMPRLTISVRLDRELSKCLQERYGSGCSRDWLVNQIVRGHLAEAPAARDTIEPFLAAHYDYRDNAFEPRRGMFDLYRAFTGDEAALSERKFYRELDDRRLKRHKREGVRGFLGLRRRRSPGQVPGARAP
jgi:hypothetical protein